MMRVYCYQTWAARFFIPEDRLSFALLLDPHMRHIKDMDYYV